MCEIEEELLTAIPIGVDEDEVEILALADSMQEASFAVEDDSAYMVPISLKEARRYMDELKYLIQENRPAMELHVESAAALIKDNCYAHFSPFSSKLHPCLLPTCAPP